MNTNPLKDVTTVTETAEMFGVTTGAVRLAIAKGTLYAERSGNVHLIKIVDALAYYGRLPQWPERLKEWQTPEN
jgi:hypothetical protein